MRTLEVYEHAAREEEVAVRLKRSVFLDDDLVEGRQWELFRTVTSGDDWISIDLPERDPEFATRRSYAPNLKTSDLADALVLLAPEIRR
jgi:hypothetical protein